MAVPIQEILASDSDTAIGLIDCIAFSTGFEFAIAVRAREEIDPKQMGFGRPDFGRTERPERQLQIGIEFADGRKALEGSHPGPELMAHWKLHQGGGEPASADGPILAHRSGGGGGRRYDFRYWVWPLPPEGRLTFTCVWPARGLGLTEHGVDATAIRRAGESSTKLWNGS